MKRIAAMAALVITMLAAPRSRARSWPLPRGTAITGGTGLMCCTR